VETAQCVFATDLGWVGIQSSDRGLRRLTLPVGSPQEACSLLGVGILPDSPPDFLADVISRLKKYFNGYRVTFPDPLDLSGATKFQRDIWNVTRQIPYGETRSYSWVAEHAGRPDAARAAGFALSVNPLPVIIPCHRVIEKSGRLGGYSGSIHLKRYLLWLETTAYMRDSM